MNAQNEVPRSAAGVQLGSDAVLEVQVFSSTYGAEYGRGAGGILNSITRSGTPQFHGNLFEYLRNSAMDARNFFDPGQEPTPFKRNQFGGTVTGPVVKDKTYFMVSFEVLKDRLTYNNQDYVPDAEARRGIITDKDGKEIRRLCKDPNTTKCDPAYVHEKVIPYVNLFPLPNQFRLGNGIARNAASQFLPTNENFLTFRIDHKISDKDGLFVRYTFDDANSDAFQPSYAFTTRSESRQQYISLVESHIFSLSTVNSLRLGYTRPVVSNTSILSIASIPNPPVPKNLYFVEDAPQFGRIQVPGLTQFGPDPQHPEKNTMNTFQFSNDVIMQRGLQGLKAGVQLHRYRWDLFSSWDKSAVWAFNSLEDFLRGGTNGTSLEVALPGSDNRVGYRQTYMGLYLHDDYKISRRFQVNAGLRYDFSTMIHEYRGRSSYLQDPARDAQVQVGPFAKDNPALLNLSPRLGFTWSPWENRETVVSAGFGIFYDQMLEYLIEQRKSTVPFYKLAIEPNFDASAYFPNATIAAQARKTRLLAEVLDYSNIRNPMVLRYNFNIRETFPFGWNLQASYVGARGNHLYRSYEANLLPIPVRRADGSLYFAPYSGSDAQDNRVNQAFGGINILSSDAQSFYNSLQVAARKNLSHGLSLQASYTWSKSVDDASTHSNETEGIGQYGGDRKLERGLSSFDARHRLAINYFYTLPFGGGQPLWNSGLLSHILGGWRLGGILSMRTGTPYTVAINSRTEGFLFAANRPNLIPGESNNPTSGISKGCAGVAPGKIEPPDFIFDPCAFSVPAPGTVGNVGRNTLIAPNSVNMDISLQRDFSLDAKRRLQFRGEIFNIANHPNFTSARSTEVVVFSGSSGRRSSSAGKTHTTTTTGRQLQFALRVSF